MIALESAAWLSIANRIQSNMAPSESHIVAYVTGFSTERICRENVNFLIAMVACIVCGMMELECPT